MVDMFPQGEPQLAPGQRVGVGRMMAGGVNKPRQGNDFYPTPPACTRALIAAERRAMVEALGADLYSPIWEPCGRGGAIMAELRRAGFDVIGTDIVADSAHGVTQQDLLTAKQAHSQVVVTNPPFALAEQMIRHLWLDLRVDYMALMLKATYWHAEVRTGLFHQTRPARIYALNWRPDFLGGGAPTMDVIWCIWQRGWADACAYHVLGPASGPNLFSENEVS
ncbi:MAG: hypothetical protein E2598_07590 [Sphingobium sp.]|nr:hypothetical protein [Sphingobium sp.]